MLSNTPNDAESKTLIGPETLLFSQLEYELKLSLKSSTARILQCFMLSNAHLTDQFNRISQVFQIIILGTFNAFFLA
jgi:hypothetical protein